jgi:hypothetical protein
VLVQDIAPAGTQVDLRDQDYFIGAVGDSWTYSRTQDGVTTPAAVTRSISGVTGSEFVLVEAETGFPDVATRYRRDTTGLINLSFLGEDTPSALATLVGEVLEYAEPFYAAGTVRRVVRQGSLGQDVDGDGAVDSVRIEFTQQYEGQDPITLPDNSASQAAHFRNVVTITISGSSLAFAPYVQTFTEDAWWAPHIGLVRSNRSAIDSERVEVVRLHKLELTGATLSGQTQFGPKVLGPNSLQKISLVHNALVADAARGVYYASVPGSVVGNGNRIATIDAATGAVSYSAPVESDPSALAMSADGSALYVGLNGSGEVLRLALPSMTEVSRTRLPTMPIYGQLHAGMMTVSPVDASVVAVSTVRTIGSQSHGGVALIRSGVLQPIMTQEQTGSNLVAFDANGQYVYGYNNENTEFGVRRLNVLADGLAEAAVVTAAVGRFDIFDLDWTSRGLVLGTSVYSTPDLALLGRTSVAGPCRAYVVPGRMMCLYSTVQGNTGQVAVVDMDTFVIRSTAVFDATGFAMTFPPSLVPGPSGQVALRVRNNLAAGEVNAIWLLRSVALQ